MKAAKLIFSCLLIPVLSLGQSIDDRVVYEVRTLEKFMKSTTYIVLDQHTESAYSKKLTEVVKEYWKITPYEIIDRATYNEYVKDKTKSFLTREHIAGDENLISMSLFMGGQRYMDRKGQLIANVKLKYYSATDEDFLYKMPTLIKNMQWQVDMAYKHKFESVDDYQNFLLKNRHVLHARKLYILKEHLTYKIDTQEKLAKYYKHDVRVVSKDVLIDAIITEDSTVAFLSIVAPAKNYSGQTGYYRIFTPDKGETMLSYERAVSNQALPGVIGYDLKKFRK